MAIRDPELASLLVASLTSGLVAIDARGRIAIANAAAQRILGVQVGAPDAWLERDFREALAARPQLVGLLQAALDGHDRPSRAELALAGGAGAPATTIGFTVLPVRDPCGTVRGAAIQFRDLAAFEQGDEQARLRDRLAALGEMAAGLAHELRNPLAGMEVMAGLLRRRLADGSEEHALVLDILTQLRAVARTLDDALEFVRPSAPSPDAVEPVPLVELALERALGRVPFAGKLERDYAPALPRVAVDPEQMLMVFTDLLVNALEAMRPCADAREPRLCLAVRPGTPARREVVVSIADNGPGVPEGLRERIFYPFFTTKPGGSGVGLAKAQKVVTSHGGALELASGGGGAIFRVRLPEAGSEG